MSKLGDFFGGIVGPLLTFVTFVIVISSFRLQKEELELTRAELSRSAFALESQELAIQRERHERSFFQMLSFLHEIVENLYLGGLQSKPAGLAVFRYMRNSIDGEFRPKYFSGKMDPTNVDELAITYESLVGHWLSQIGHYFRFLYRLFLFIEIMEDGQFYAKIVRSQISDEEFVVIFYNCLTRNGQSFKRLATKFALFDNLNVELLLHETHVNFFPREAFGKNSYFIDNDNDD